MKCHKTDNIKKIFLLGILSICLIISGCASNSTITNQEELEKDKSYVYNTNNQSTDLEKYEVYSQSNSINTTLKTIPQDYVQGTINKAVDGDTIKIKLIDTGEIITLRLLLVDTPESVKPGVKPQPYSIEASNFTKETLNFGDTVYIEYDNGDKTDKYNRHLGYLWYYSKDSLDLKLFNDTLIRKGYARVGYIYSQKKYLNLLNESQNLAKSENLNIWSVDGYVTKDGYNVDAYNKNLNMVYISKESSKQKKYHKKSDAHNMKIIVKVKESEAKSLGYEPCKICY